MNRYSPLWSHIVDSSLWAEPDFVVKVFLTLIAKKDMDDVVRGSAYNIALWCRKTEAETLEALKVLSSPDTRRLEPQQYDGKRIEKVDGGWKVLNGAHYRELMKKANKNSYKARWQSAARAKSKLAQNEAEYLAAEKRGEPQEVLDAITEKVSKSRRELEQQESEQ